MRIALTITELHPGGAENCLVNLACWLQQRGHEVQVWQLWPPPPESRRQLTDRLDDQNIPWHSGNAVRAWHFPGAVGWLATQLSEFSPDVVQSFLFHANVAAAWAMRRSSVPLVGGVRVRQPQWIRGWLQRSAVRRMRHVVCVSQSVAEHCVRDEGLPREKVVVIPNGIYLPNAADGDVESGRASDRPSSGRWSELGLPADARVLLSVGRLDEQKGVLDLVSMAPQFLEDLPRHHLVLMGEGPQRSQLEEKINRSSVADRIHLVGWQPQPLSWMRQCDVLVLAARYEGMPNVVMEAMSVGTPVMSFAVEGVEELLGDSTTARAQRVAPQDFDAFGQQLVQLANDSALREACGQANRSRIAEHFQLDTQLSKYEQLYVQAIRGL